MGERWTEPEVRMLASVAYFPVLRKQLRGEAVVKVDYLRAAERSLPGRTHHTLKDRCYRMSEVLRDAGLPYVVGWNPPDEVGQTPNSVGVTSVISRAILRDAASEFGKSG